MIRAEPYSLFSWDFTVYEDGTPVADVDLAWVREAGEMNIEGTPYRVYREPGFGDFVLDSEGRTLVRGHKSSAFLRTFEITYNDELLILKARSAFGRTFELFEDDRRIGVIAPDHVFSRKMRVDLPPTMPLAVCVFIVWLVVLMWKRAAGSSG